MVVVLNECFAYTNAGRYSQHNEESGNARITAHPKIACDRRRRTPIRPVGCIAYVEHLAEEPMRGNAHRFARAVPLADDQSVVKTKREPADLSECSSSAPSALIFVVLKYDSVLGAHAPGPGASLSKSEGSPPSAGQASRAYHLGQVRPGLFNTNRRKCLHQ